MLNRFSLLLFLILLAAIRVNSQDTHAINSLRQTLKRSAIPKDSMNALFDLGFAYFDTHHDSCYHYTNRSFKLAKQIGDSLVIVKSGRVSGQMLWRLGELKKSIDILNLVRPIALRHKMQDEYEKIINALGLAYTLTGKYDKALKYQFESLELREKTGEKEKISVALQNIGLVYFKLGNNSKAIEYYERSLKMKKEIVSILDKDVLLFNISLAYAAAQEDFAKARKYLNEALLMCSQDCSSDFLINAEFGKAFIEYKSRNVAGSAKYFLKVYELSTAFNNDRFKLESIVYLTTIALKEKNYTLAEKYLYEAEEINSRLSYNTLEIQIYSLFSDLYNDLKNYKKATVYQSKYIQLRDSIYSEELTQNLMVVQAEYAQRENATKIESQNKVLDLKQQAINRQYWLMFLAGTAVILLVIFVVILFRSIRQKKEINVVLEEKVKERSSQLAANFRKIEQAYEEQRLLLKKTSEEINEPVVELKNLCELIEKEALTEEEKLYVEQLNLTTKGLINALQKLSSSSNR